MKRNTTLFAFGAMMGKADMICSSMEAAVAPNGEINC